MNVVAFVYYFQMWIERLQSPGIFSHRHSGGWDAIPRIAGQVIAIRHTPNRPVSGRTALRACDPFATNSLHLERVRWRCRHRLPEQCAQFH